MHAELIISLVLLIALGRGALLQGEICNSGQEGVLSFLIYYTEVGLLMYIALYTTKLKS